MSKKFTEYQQFNLSAVGKEMQAEWEKNDVFKKSIETREGCKPFIFFEGPPSANGMPGIHHVMARSIKDLFLRYKTMQGFKVTRKAGWDTHGLPVELGVEKALGITKEDIGKELRIAGFVENIRDHGGIIFVDVRDESGTVQTVSNDDKIFDGITRESSITLLGTIRKRSEDTINPRLETGELELLVTELEVLGKAKNELPFEVMTSHEVNEELRLKYRYLDLRNKKVHDNILFRSELLKHLRNKMDSLGFTEVQTPIITASSPEGARDFVIPSRKHHGKFYALPQAPQIFKQLLMTSGFDR